MARKQDRRKSSPAAAILTVLVLAALFVWRMLASPEDGKTQITLSNGELAHLVPRCGAGGFQSARL